MAGDRRATAGNLIAVAGHREGLPGRRVLRASAIAGSAGIGAELIRLFQVELEHYEKIEGTTLSMEGKANKLGMLLRSNLGMAMQGLAVVPLFAGFDLRPAAAGSSPTTSPAAATRSGTSTRSAPARCSLAGR